MPKLVIYCGDSHQERELGTEPVTCGRGKTATVTVPDGKASREHCRFELAGGRWYVADMGSSNGTYVDGRQVKREELRNGCVVRIGDTRITFVDEAAAPEPSAAEPPASPAAVPPGIAAEVKPPEPAFSLRAHGGPRDGETFALAKPVTRIGRSRKNDIVLEEGSVSAYHAELIVAGREARIIDKDSRNGVRVNDVHVKERALDPGDRIAVGSTNFEFVSGAEPAAAGGTGPEAAAAPDEGTGERTPKEGAAKVLTWRVKAVALLVILIIAAGLASKLVTPERPAAVAYPDNLLKENPSFEEGGGSSIPGWVLAKGTAGRDTRGAEDGQYALRLVAEPRVTADVSALCWSNEIAIPEHGRKAYELSAFVRNSGGQSASLCVMWTSRAKTGEGAGQGKEIHWLWTPQLGRRTDDALEWRQVSEVFTPPSWATNARFGCAVIGPGAAQFDGFYLRETGAPVSPSQVSAGRLAFEPAGRGEVTVFAGGKPILSRARLAVTAGGREMIQALASLEPGYPKLGSQSAQYVGRLGLDGKVPFTEVISSDGKTMRQQYELTTAEAPDAVVALEFTSDRGLLAGPLSLTTSRGSRITESAPFEQRADVVRMTFFSGAERIFLQLSEPAIVSAHAASSAAAAGGAEEASDTVSWRIEFRSTPKNGRINLALTWTPNDRERNALLIAELQAAAKAREQDELGKAAKAYRDFLARYSMYEVESAEAANRLKEVKEQIAARIRDVNSRVARARASLTERDFESAQASGENLLKQLGDSEGAEALAKSLEALKAERRAALAKRRVDDATAALQHAKLDIENQQPNTARARLEYIIKNYAGTPAAKEAAELLKTLPILP